MHAIKLVLLRHSMSQATVAFKIYKVCKIEIKLVCSLKEVLDFAVNQTFSGSAVLSRQISAVPDLCCVVTRRFNQQQLEVV